MVARLPAKGNQMLPIVASLLLIATQASCRDAGVGDAASAAGPEGRQAQVAARGATVMPFDLERTTHLFEPRADGGVQTVISDDADAKQVQLVRKHLHEQAAFFAKGDYASPAAIHGHDMPGLAELSAGASRIRVLYEATENGARLRFVTPDAALVAAIHRWFSAQRSDHGQHASHAD
jgi:hypothetical protein